MMGHAGGQVNIMQWRAAFQRDIDQAPPTVHRLPEPLDHRAQAAPLATDGE